MICNKAGSAKGCAVCVESKPHHPAARLVPENIIERVLCMETGKPVEVNLIPAKEEHMSKETATVVPTGQKTVKEESLFTHAPYTPPQIDMIPVESSNIEAVGHDGAETLRVRFKGSATRPATDYDYVGIVEDDFIGLVNSESVGRAYQALTKGKGITGIKIEVPA